MKTNNIFNLLKNSVIWVLSICFVLYLISLKRLFSITFSFLYVLILGLLIICINIINKDCKKLSNLFKSIFKYSLIGLLIYNAGIFVLIKFIELLSPQQNFHPTSINLIGNTMNLVLCSLFLYITMCFCSIKLNDKNKNTYKVATGHLLLSLFLFLILLTSIIEQTDNMKIYGISQTADIIFIASFLLALEINNISNKGYILYPVLIKKDIILPLLSIILLVLSLFM